MTQVLDGRPVARDILAAARDDIARISKQIGGAPPALAIVLAGDDASAVTYARAIRRTCKSAGLPFRMVTLPGNVHEDEFRRTMEMLNTDTSVAGIIVLQPLPPHLPNRIASETIDPAKDIDGITPINLGHLMSGNEGLAPSTPSGGMAILRHYQIPLEGRRAVVVGRSLVVGRPFGLMLLAANATVTVCHSRSTNLADITREADILASATGRPGMVTAEMVKPGATIIDFGVNVHDGKITGDVDPGVADIAGALTPVPGGTGVVTTAVLVQHTLKAAWSQIGRNTYTGVGAGLRSCARNS